LTKSTFLIRSNCGVENDDCKNAVYNWQSRSGKMLNRRSAIIVTPSSSAQNIATELEDLSFETKELSGPDWWDQFAQIAGLLA